ncbi:helicase-related protein [Bacillus thermotolerans]|uniref:RNA helicase n=1 Tax=Bacillus thermotolerans TaxID=1221996 RepID=A0A0F5HKF1_BACTR|nr:helicase-related protein [Bacillus thermotolerans]KKB33874.1 hypothetical protein QY97_02955 [Bacillus thermotolerans]KKB36726.1 hypothetical protein QY95_02994 [Bacillus thermotolerans]
MDKFTSVYSKAISHTKQKIQEDISAYLGSRETAPSFKQYVSDRYDYTRQIWLNVWLNKASNEVPAREKKHYLRERGIAVKDVPRKTINQLFRNEIREHEPFDVVRWLKEKYEKRPEDWQIRYEEARAAFLAEEEEKQQQREQARIRHRIYEEAERLIEEKQEKLYLPFRHMMAKHLEEDLQTNIKFRQIDPTALEQPLVEAGRFQAEDYETVEAFFHELTGGIRRGEQWDFEYESYGAKYEELAADAVFDYMAKAFLDHLPSEVKESFQKVNEEELTKDHLQDMMGYLLSDLTWEFFEELEEENLQDLLRLAPLPFEEPLHEKIYKQDLRAREERIAEAIAAEQRKKEEEARLIEDIFGQAYQPPAERNVRYVLHIGETNTGKTHRALQRMKEAKSGLYLAPLRLLAFEVYERLNKEGIPCLLKTGEEEKETPGARHASCTVEMFHEKDEYEVVVIDEAQMIADKDRGFSWYKAITGARAQEVHIIASQNMKPMLVQLLGDSEYELIEYRRDVPLQVEPTPFRLPDAAKGDALVCFSRREVLETAAKLKRNRFAVSMIYGSMPPETRKRQMEQFVEGKTTVIVATDAIGMGLNLPIRRIVFLKNEKFDGTRRRWLTSQEVKQIAGRAGRKGIYPVGKVAFVSNIDKMAHLLEKEDEPVTTFAIAPTSAVFERFQRYSRHLALFFDLWERYKSPEGTKKASLDQERYLYELIEGSEIEARLPMTDLYGFLHLPFSTKEPGLTKQWISTMYAIVNNTPLPEPSVKTGTLEDLELSYKTIGLHLLFLYRLGKPTEAIYWERLRETLSEDIHKQLQSREAGTGKTCRRCRKTLPENFKYQICDSCHASRRKRKYVNKRF